MAESKSPQKPDVVWFVWDSEEKIWLRRLPADAKEIVRSDPKRFSATEEGPEPPRGKGPAEAPEPEAVEEPVREINHPSLGGKRKRG